MTQSVKPSFRKSKESLHNFENKLLYIQGYKSLKMSQMYDALRETSRTDTKQT
eukprot:CAMPEP_0185599070 /NCGR_PEP_ID=MMETSP0434-20130131/82440_1 /TAXON_ID=626734 ORGANISM="Favella taraikaensis, Strain Fe Narragansett Bay" /NCGR_SAMPLE_ID=MMETSP0434 /ASSEMBLY_ACC=CAM_ASM_000379 /LENGTH=52 /DNA_ID=CAMNT_0028228307 /DNA_START=212 /DNA_END=370 /DNA_ORIENTATION=-